MVHHLLPPTSQHTCPRTLFWNTTGLHAQTHWALLTSHATCTTLYSLASVLVNYYNHTIAIMVAVVKWFGKSSESQFGIWIVAILVCLSIKCIACAWFQTPGTTMFWCGGRSLDSMVKGHLLQSWSQAVGDCNGGKCTVLPLLMMTFVAWVAGDCNDGKCTVLPLLTTTEKEIEHPNCLDQVQCCMQWVSESS